MEERTKSRMIYFAIAAWVVAAAALFSMWPFIAATALMIGAEFLSYFLQKRKCERDASGAKKAETKKEIMYRLMWGIGGIFISAVLFGLSYLA